MDMNKSKPFCETPLEKYNDIVISSTVHDPSEEEMQAAKELFEQGKCNHTIVFDEYGWMYDFRKCYTCGMTLGVI